MRPSNIHWNALFDYDAEVKRGIVHTPEYDEKMRAERVLFDRSRERPCVVCGHPSLMTFCRAGRPVSEGTHACGDCVELVATVIYA
jgi:hypothetical protein